MDTDLIITLRIEERELLAALRDSLPFRRLEEVQRLLALYGAPPPVGAGLDALLASREAPADARRMAPQSVIALHGSERA